MTENQLVFTLVRLLWNNQRGALKHIFVEFLETCTDFIKHIRFVYNFINKSSELLTEYYLNPPIIIIARFPILTSYYVSIYRR